MIKVYGSKKSENHCVFELAKTQEFIAGFRQFLVDLGFDKDEHHVYRFGRPIDTMGEPIEDKEENVSEYVDRHFCFLNDAYNIDVIFGKERVFLIINSKVDKQEEISEKLVKFVTF